MKRFWVVAMLCALCGCGESVESNEPMGQDPAPDLSQWEGAWVLPSRETWQIEVVDPDQGELSIVATEKAGGDEPDDAPRVTTVRAFVRRGGDRTYLSFECVDEDCAAGDGPADAYLWAAAEMENGSVRVSVPRAEEFVKLLDQGLLQGYVNDGDVVLVSLEERHYRAIDDDAKTLFDAPMTLLTRVDATSAGGVAP